MSNSKPIETFSQKELDRYIGEWKDLTDEQKQMAHEYGVEDRIEGIYQIVAGIMNMHRETGTLYKAQVLVCNPIHKEPAFVVSRMFKLSLFCHVKIPQNEILVAEESKLETLLVSRSISNLEIGKIIRTEPYTGWGKGNRTELYSPGYRKNDK